MEKNAFVRRRVERIVDSLEYDFDNFSMDDYVAWVEKFIKRRIAFIPWKMPIYMTGLWLTDAEDSIEYIFIADNLPPLLEIQVKLHELGHILNNHTTTAVTHEMLQLLRTGEIDIEMLSQPFLKVTRSVAPDLLEQETEAEHTAAIIQERINQAVRTRKLSDGSLDAQTQAFLRNIGLG